MTTKEIDKFYERLGERIKKARMRMTKYSQDDLGKIIGLSRTSIVNIESGRQKLQIHTLSQIAHALKVDTATLIPAGTLEITDLPQVITSQVTEKELSSVANIVKHIKEDDNDGQNQKNSQRITVKRKSK
jgi:DNA-binding XRE family transcriptional regulator